MKRPALIGTLFTLLFFVVGIFSPAWGASRQDYYDWGPYYATSPKVLGFRFSSLEELPPFTLPESAEASSPGIIPGNPLYPIERFAEGVQLAFTFNPEQRQLTQLSFAGERLSEAQESIERGNPSAFAQAISNYENTLAAVTSRLDQTPNVLSQVEEVVATHAVLLENISFSAPPTTSQDLSSAIESAHETLDNVSEASGEPVIPEGFATSLQKLKDQGLMTSEEVEKLYGLESRSQVREEIEKLASVGLFPIAEITRLDTAIEEQYPDAFEHALNNLEFAELRTYQALPAPSDEIAGKIGAWLAGPSDTPSPPEIRPYLYTVRARELAGEINFSQFESGQQAEVTKLYPEEAVKNPTYSSVTPVESPAPTPSPTSEPGAEESTTASEELIQNYIPAPTGPIPGDFTYFGKRIGETFRLATTFDREARLEYRMRLAEERLSEASHLYSNSDRSDEYQNTLERYQTEVGRISDGLKNYPVSLEREGLAKRLESQASRHEAIFETGLIPPPEENPQIIGEVIAETQKAMDRSADALGKPALPPALGFRLQDLKAQGVILEEEIAGLTESTSREEVREKIKKLGEEGSIPPAEAKRLDEAQNLTIPTNFNQLIEVRKVEELQTLRAIQTELAQTPTLKSTNDAITSRVGGLTAAIDISLINPEDLSGNDALLAAYEGIRANATPRPINGGQFSNVPTTTDVDSATCPIGAVFKESEGCVWENTGKKINDYEQYKCDGPRQYYSFQAKTCVPYTGTGGAGANNDYQPICPAGYTWDWSAQSCETSKGVGSELKQYQCKQGNYYSFGSSTCVSFPKKGEPWPDDAAPKCDGDGTFWDWSQGKCRPEPSPAPRTDIADLDVPQPVFVTPESPFYFIKRSFEGVQSALAITPGLKARVRISQARERFAEAYDALSNGNEEDFQKVLGEYTERMQDLYNDLGGRNLSDAARKAVADRITQTAAEQNLLLGKAKVLASEDSQAAISAASSINLLGIDKAADIRGEPAIPDEVRERIEGMTPEMITDEKKAEILGAESRVEARIELTNLATNGLLTPTETAFLNEPLGEADFNAQVKLEELQKLREVADLTQQSEEIDEKIKENEDVVQKLEEFERTFEPGDSVDAEIRPYVRLTRIDEVAQTIRPDLVNLQNFGNRKDVQLAIATLQQEQRPTKEAFRQVEDFRRRNPNSPLPPNLARIEALSFSLGVRDSAEACFLPSPPFPANTPCPAPGAAIPFSSYYSSYSSNFPGIGGFGQNWQQPTQAVDKDGKPLVYGQGPTPASPGACPDGYHWMYDSGGWCMSNSGSYGSSYSYTPTGPGANYTPYSPYYTAPGAPPGTYGYPVDGSYQTSNYYYGAPSYYGPAPNYYTTNPPSGTVPGSGPRPISPGQCPSGYHWMSDSGGWCMANGGTYVPTGTYTSYPYGSTTSDTPPPGGYNCGGQSGGFSWDGSRCAVASPNLNQSSCGPGYYWSNGSCFPNSGGGGYSTTSSYQYGCTPGYFWDGSKCVAGSYEGSGWSDTSARSQSWCQPPSSGCGSNSYWDYGSCYCRASNTYYGGGGSTPSNQCQGLSCGGGAWLDYSTCSCRYSGGSGTSSTGSPITCYPPSQGCPGGWYDYGTCSCKTSSSTSTTSSGSSGSSSGSCPSGYHWMSDNGGWCMADGGGSSTTSTTTTSSPAPAPTTETQPPPPSSEPAPPPQEPPPPSP